MPVEDILGETVSREVDHNQDLEAEMEENTESKVLTEEISTNIVDQTETEHPHRNEASWKIKIMTLRLGKELKKWRIVWYQ